jgi:hypothetical protein
MEREGCSVNSNILIAFAAGAVIASGIVFVAVRPEEAVNPAPVVVVQRNPPVIVPVAQADPPPVAAPPPAVAPPESQPPSVPAPARQKPSPLRTPVRRERPMIIARTEKPPQEPVPSPMPASINTERPYNDAKPAEPTPLPSPVPDPVPPPVVTAPPAPAPQQQEVPPPVPIPETRTPNTVTIQPGTILAVRIGETISSTRNEVGDNFLATLDRPLVVDGFVIAERGARAEGRVVEAQHPGRANGQSHLGIEIIELSTSDGQRMRVRTATFKKESASSTGRDLAIVGAGAAIGAAIGAAAGGGKGAAIGAGVGGAAGTADVLLTHGKPAEIPVETRMSFRIQEPITITERLQ